MSRFAKRQLSTSRALVAQSAELVTVDDKYLTLKMNLHQRLIDVLDLSVIEKMNRDDFEKQTSGQAPAGAFKVSSSTILVDGTKPYSGTKSVHIKVAPGGAASELTFSTQFPFNEEHGRLMMFMTRVPTNGSHWDIVHSRNPSTDWEIGGQFGAFEFVADPPDHGVLSKTKVPVGKWFCLQWEFKYGGAGMPNTFVAKMDGTALEQGMFTGPNSRGESWVAGPWRSLNLGWVGYQASNVEMELWIDGLAFGEQDIACPAVQ